MIVDDSHEFLQVASQLLKRGGIAVAGTATSISSAFDLIARLDRIDAVLVDLHLGEESGADLIAQMATEDPDVALICIVTHTDDTGEELDAALPTGAVRLPRTHLSAAAIRDIVQQRAGR